MAFNTQRETRLLLIKVEKTIIKREKEKSERANNMECVGFWTQVTIINLWAGCSSEHNFGNHLSR